MGINFVLVHLLHLQSYSLCTLLIGKEMHALTGDMSLQVSKTSHSECTDIAWNIFVIMHLVLRTLQGGKALDSWGK